MLTRKKCSISDAHWTILGFTASNGKPVMRAVILVSQMLSFQERLGNHIFTPMPTTETNSMFSLKYHGPGKYFPGGPRCMF